MYPKLWLALKVAIGLVVFGVISYFVVVPFVLGQVVN